MMFCPNCGKDCREFKFCPECGKALQVKEESTEEKRARMKAEGILFCPECLSTSVALKENNHTRHEHQHYCEPILKMLAIGLEQIRKRRDRIYGHIGECNDCGFRWYPKTYALHDRYSEIAAQLWKDDPSSEAATYGFVEDTYWQLDKSAILIKRHGKKFVVPYMDLAAVAHKKPCGDRYGTLSVRNKPLRRKCFPGTYESAKRDKLTAMYSSKWEKELDELYGVLEQIIAENKAAGVI